LEEVDMDAKVANSVAREEAEKAALGKAIIGIQQAAKGGATSLVFEVSDMARKYVHTELKSMGYTVRYMDNALSIKWDLC
jgi:uncharacterized protein (UPF0335 family)